MLSRLAGFVCPTVSMVTTGHATGVEKTLFGHVPQILRKFLEIMGKHIILYYPFGRRHGRICVWAY